MTVHQAPAKLTWFLEVTKTRDTGWHELRSEMVTLSLCDELDIDETSDYVMMSGETNGVEPGPTNLVSRALLLANRRAGVSLTKHIPTGGGLGGGSADAGAILRWAGGVSVEAALTLGSDVPFCQLGGRALVEGLGEQLTRAGEARDPRNHLTRAAQLVEPRVAIAQGWLAAEFGEEVVLAGSGATLFIEGHLRTDIDQWEVESPVGRVRLRQVQTTPAGA